MKQGKIAIFILLLLSLTLTAGYAQALPDLSFYGYKSAASTSFYDLIASKLSGIFGNIPAWNVPSSADFPSLNYISKNEAISIAKSLWPTATWRGPATVRWKPGVYIVTITGFAPDWEGDCPEGYFIPGTCAGGEVTIDSKTGEIISVTPWL
ncbi:hypothetical protein J2741_000307 [Methanolinea mesophila]|uniref:hypothetical protein n=1 Tax=Methanolinea mesophila TaxID=547055 RepID=UPI001AE45742|nr:hypothetical protein [Methanolinea mesophila]MBP1927760.1 hypothetical protein [Methanolinea mesophila]